MSVAVNADSALGPHLAVLKKHAGSFGSECWLLQGHFLPYARIDDPRGFSDGDTLLFVGDYVDCQNDCSQMAFCLENYEIWEPAPFDYGCGKYNRDPWESCDNYVQTEYGRVEMPLLEPEMDGRYFQVRGIPYFWGIATVCDHPAPIALEPHSYAPCLGDTLSPTFRLSWGEVKDRFLRQQQVRAK